MDFTQYFAVLVVLCLEGGETGGHGEKHHDHVKLHIPEFIHHDRHTKVVTIHHHHHEPKKEHHHHHHHHHHKKPQIPHGHHYHHHKNSHTIKTTVTKHGGHGHLKHHGHSNLGHHGHHMHHGHHDHHGHHGQHGHGHHHDTPTYSYDPPQVPTFEEDFGSSYTPSVPSYGAGIGPQTPQVSGVSHTVKQVKVFDSLPGVIPTNTRSHGYEVTEDGEDTGDDVFTSVNAFQQAFPATYGYLRGAAPHPVAQNAYVPPSPQSIGPTNTHDPFASSEAFPAEFTGDGFGAAPNSPLVPTAHNIGYSNVVFQGDSGIENPHSFSGFEGDSASFADGQGSLSDDTPVSFAREVGIQHSSNTGGVQTVLY